MMKKRKANKRYKNCLDSRLFKGCSPLRLLCNLTGDSPAIGNFSYCHTLAQISKFETVSPRTLFNMFRLDKIVYVLLTGHAPRTIENWPARRQLSFSVNKITILPCTRTWPSRDNNTCGNSNLFGKMIIKI